MKNKKLALILASLILLTGCQSNSRKSENTKPKEENEIHYSIGGKEIDDSKMPIFAIILDNHSQARPQSGINNAEIIYEFKAEGENTRYMALFQSKLPDLIGSVRSARPYFVDVAKEYNAIFTHWGGSDAGYNEISSTGIKDLDGIELEGSTFFRKKDTGKKRPHDGYTSKDLLMEKAKERNYLEDIKEVNYFNYDNSENKDKLTTQMQSVEATKLILNYFKSYVVSFEYTPDSNSYLINRNNESLIDEKDKTKVSANNIIVQFSDSKITGPKETLTISNTGEGKGLLLSQGKVIDIDWTKKDASSKTEFFVAGTKDKIVLSPGLTFVEVIDKKENVQIEPQTQTENKAEVDNTKK